MSANGQYKVFKNQHDTSRADGDVAMIGSEQEANAMMAQRDRLVIKLTIRERRCSWLALRFFASCFLSGAILVFNIIQGYEDLMYLFIAIVAIKICVSVTCFIIAKDAKQQLRKLAGNDGPARGQFNA